VIAARESHVLEQRIDTILSARCNDADDAVAVAALARREVDARLAGRRIAGNEAPVGAATTSS